MTAVLMTTESKNEEEQSSTTEDAKTYSTLHICMDGSGTSDCHWKIPDQQLRRSIAFAFSGMFEGVAHLMTSGVFGKRNRGRRAEERPRSLAEQRRMCDVDRGMEMRLREQIMRNPWTCPFSSCPFFHIWSSLGMPLHLTSNFLRSDIDLPILR